MRLIINAVRVVRARGAMQRAAESIGEPTSMMALDTDFLVIEEACKSLVCSIRIGIYQNHQRHRDNVQRI